MHATLRAALGVSAFLAACAPARADVGEASSAPTLTVRGTGSHEQKPDYATFRASVTTRGKTAEEVTRAHEERAPRAVAALRDLQDAGVRVVRTNFLIREVKRPRYPSNDGRKAVEEPYFEAISQFDVSVPVADNFAATAGRIAKIGLFELSSMQYKVNDERVALNQARRAAMRDSKDQAQAYAEAGEFTLLGISSVSDGEASPANGEADMPFRSFVQIIPPAVVAFTAAVTVTWRIGPN